MTPDPSFEWTSQTGRSARAFHTDLGALVFDDIRTGAFERRSSPGIARQHHTTPRCKCEHVRTHAVEFFVRHFHEVNSAIEQPLAKWHGQQPRVDDRHTV